MLTDTQCRTAKPKDKPYKPTDGKGLHLEVKPNGSKAWRYRFELRTADTAKESTLSYLWDGNPIDRSRSMTGESLRAYDRRLSLHLMLQPYLAGQLLKDPLLNGQGIFARCLITWPQSLAGQRFYQPVDLTQDISLKRYTQRITDLLQRPWAIGSDGALHPKALPLRSLARQTWINLHDTIEAQLGEFDELANVRPSASKAADNLLRIAGVFAVLEDREMIEVTHIQRASSLMDYYLTEIQRLTEQEPINTQREEADRLLRWLQEKQWPPFTVRDLLRNGPRFARKSSHHTLALLVELITHQWLGGPTGTTSRYAIFRLNEALRNRRAQAKNAHHLQLVATTVATLSPRSTPGTTGLVATVAAVAKNQGDGSHISDLIERLHQEGAELFCLDNRLCFRPNDWGQLPPRERPVARATGLPMPTGEGAPGWPWSAGVTVATSVMVAN